VQDPELAGRARQLGDDGGGRGAGGDEALGRRRPSAALAREDEQRGRGERDAVRAPEHPVSLAW
jgi:hypothetical protein